MAGHSLEIARGDILVLAPPSGFSKPRPALVIQQHFDPAFDHMTVALISSDLTYKSAWRIPISPLPDNGLRKPSEVLVDNLQTVRISRIGSRIGRASAETMNEVDAALRVFLGLR